MILALNIIFYVLIFFMGSVFGSFFTLAVYRIPLNLDITHKRSFCPNCNHRLEFIDLIPIISYLSLGGKCRYCGQKIRIRYLLLEVLSGLVFLCASFVFRLNFPFFDMSHVIAMVFFVMFYVTNAIILGIDKEYIKIDKRVLLFGIITESIYMLYLYTFEQSSLNLFLVLLVAMLILFCIDTFEIRKNKKSSYLLQNLMLLVYEIMYIENWKIILGMGIGSVIIWAIYKIYKKKNIPIGFCICLSSIISVLVGNIIL